MKAARKNEPTDSEQGENASFLERWVLQPIKQQLTQGISPAKIAQAIAFGLTLGIFPILGSTTLLCLLVGVPLKLNQPILQSFQAIATPLQWATILGFYRLGEMLYGAPHVSLSIPKMMDRFFSEPGPFFHDYGMTALYGITVWCLLAPAILLILYLIAHPLIKKMAERIQRRFNVTP